MPQIPNQNNKIWGGNNGYPQQNVVNVNGNINANIDNNFISKVALVLAILSFTCCCIDFLFSIPAVICAIIALIKNKKDITAWAAIIIASLSLIVYIFAAISGALESISDSISNKDNKTETKVGTETRIEVETNNNNTTKDLTSEDTTNTNDKISISNDRQSETKEIKYEITDMQFYTFTNSIGSGEYLFIMEIKNTGDCNLYLDSCTVDLEDKDGHLLQTGDSMSSCPSVIKPGEIGYFYNGILDKLIDKNVNINDIASCIPHVEITEARKEPVEYEVSDLSLSKEYGCAKIVGRVTNTTDKDDSSIYLNFIFYDNTSKILGIGGTTVYDIKAGETIGFDYNSMYIQGDFDYSDIVDYKVIAQKDYWQW